MNLKQHNTKFYALFLLVFGFSSNVFAGDCANATSIPSTIPSLASASWISDLHFSGSACTLNSINDARSYTAFSAPNTCSKSVWYKWDPQNPGTVVDVTFEFRFSSVNNPVNFYLLYSESKDANTACDWSSGGPPGAPPTTHPPLSVVKKVAHWGGAVWHGQFATITASGLDGSGVYFLVAQSAGSGGEIGMRSYLTTGAGPRPVASNDDCINATVLSAGSGIDPGSIFGSANSSWSDASCGSIRDATKKRPTIECNNGGETEDHWWRAFCAPRTYCNIGNIDNNVWFKFRLPAGAQQNGWYLQFGDLSCTGWGYLQVAVIRETSSGASICSRGQLGTVVSNCGQADIHLGSTLPNANGIIGPLNGLTLNRDYYIMVDGFQYAQCDFCVLLTRENQNPVLPVEISNFNAWNDDYQNLLEWETSMERNSDYFSIERSLDGQNFDEIGDVTAIGFSDQNTTYSFTDKAAPVGISSYRLRITDIDGKFEYSDVVEVMRVEPELAFNEVYPVPFQDELKITFSSSTEVATQIELLDTQGRVVFSEYIQAQSGGNPVNLLTNKLGSGVYILRLTQPRGQIVKKVVKQ